MNTGGGAGKGRVVPVRQRGRKPLQLSQVPVWPRLEGSDPLPFSEQEPCRFPLGASAPHPAFLLPGRSGPPVQRPRDLLAGDLRLPLRAGLGGCRLRGARLPRRLQRPRALRGRPLRVRRALRGGRLRPPRLPRELQRAGRVRARAVPVPRGLHVGGLQRAALPRRLQWPRLLRHGRVLLRGGLHRPGLLAG